MSWKKKWEEMQIEQKVKDIEFCEKHPTGWKIMAGLFAFGFGALIVFMTLAGAYPLAVIAFVFAVWLGREYLKIYRNAFPKNVIL